MGCRVIIIDQVCLLGWLIIRVGHLSKSGYSDLLSCNLLRYVGKLRPHVRRDQSLLGGRTFRPSVVEEGCRMRISSWYVRSSRKVWLICYWHWLKWSRYKLGVNCVPIVSDFNAGSGCVG